MIIFINLKMLSLKFSEFFDSGINKAFFAVLSFGALMFLAKLFQGSLFFTFFVVLLVIAFLYAWVRHVLDSRDINFIKSLFTIINKNAGA